MDAKIFRAFVGYSCGFGWLYYAGNAGYEYYNKDNQLKA